MNNTVEYIGHYGDDLTHGLSAWTSTRRDIDDEKMARLPKMLAGLAADGHHTPFEKSALHFLVNTDVATHIHIIKHRIAVPVNGESARYKELKEDKFYVPEDWIKVFVTDPAIVEEYSTSSWYNVLMYHTERGNNLYHAAIKDLTIALGRKRAKESARFFKGYNSQMTADVMFNWRSFHHFLTLRNDDHAQVEVHAIAKEMLEIVKALPGEPFKHTIAAFNL